MGAARVDETRQEFAAADQMREGERRRSERKRTNPRCIGWGMGTLHHLMGHSMGWEGAHYVDACALCKNI